MGKFSSSIHFCTKKDERCNTSESHLKFWSQWHDFIGALKTQIKHEIIKLSFSP